MTELQLNGCLTPFQIKRYLEIKIINVIVGMTLTLAPGVSCLIVDYR